jgi:3-hydroxyacyl-[acyl-carrier-protein] dehydratase
MSDVAKRTDSLNSIRRAIPHRYPFLLVDRVIEVSADGRRAVAIKNVTANEPFFQGHFPDNAIMPGVLIVEALAQAGGASLLGPILGEGTLAMLAGIDGFRFRKPVVPGDVLRLEVELTRVRGPIGKVHGRALVDGDLVAEGEITFALVPLAEAAGGAT